MREMQKGEELVLRREEFDRIGGYSLFSIGNDERFFIAVSKLSDDVWLAAELTKANKKMFIEGIFDKKFVPTYMHFNLMKGLKVRDTYM